MRGATAKELRRQAKATDGVNPEREYDRIETLHKRPGPDGKVVLTKSIQLVNKPTSERGVYRALKKGQRRGTKAKE